MRDLHTSVYIEVPRREERQKRSPSQLFPRYFLRYYCTRSILFRHLTHTPPSITASRTRSSAIGQARLHQRWTTTKERQRSCYRPSKINSALECKKQSMLGARRPWFQHMCPVAKTRQIGFACSAVRLSGGSNVGNCYAHASAHFAHASLYLTMLASLELMRPETLSS